MTCARWISDIYCAPFIQGTSEPGGPVLVADLKNDDLATARKESALYGVNSARIQKGRQRWEIMIGIPGSKQQMDLEVYIPGNGVFWRVPVVEGCSPFDRALLCTIYTAVHYLSRHPITQDSALNLKPEKTFQVEPYPTRFRVFVDTDKRKVYKLFDEENKAMQPNSTLLSNLGFNCDCRQLSSDGRFCMLEINYIPGNHNKPACVSSFCGAVNQLHKIHKKNMVHGDIRTANIVFDRASSSSSLIDFDLAREEMTNYPPTYVTSFHERHSEARPGKPMRKMHDKHSLFWIIVKFFPSKKSLDLVDKGLETWMDALSD